MNHVSGHSCPVSCFTGDSFCIVKNGKMHFGPVWNFGCTISSYHWVKKRISESSHCQSGIQFLEYIHCRQPQSSSASDSGPLGNATWGHGSGSRRRPSGFKVKSSIILASVSVSSLFRWTRTCSILYFNHHATFSRRLCPVSHCATNRFSWQHSKNLHILALARTRGFICHSTTTQVKKRGQATQCNHGVAVIFVKLDSF